MEDRLPDNFIDPRLSEDKLNLNENKLPDNFIDPRQIQEEPEEETILGEIPKGLKAGVQQLRGMGYGLGALAGQAVGSESVLDWAREGLKDVEEKTPKPAVGSISDIESVSDVGKYLSYGVASNLPNMALSLTGGGIGAVAGKKIVGEATKQVVKKAIQRGAMTGAGLSSLGMEAGSIAGDQLTETGKVDPVRAMLGAIPAAALDVIPEWYLFKRLGIFGDVTEEVKKGIKNRLLRGGKDFAKQFGMEAPTEAMQSVIERASVPGKSITNKEAWDEYINSFVLGGATGGVVGGAGGMFARAQKEASEETPVQKIIKEDPTANDIEIQLAEADPEGITKIELAKGDIETKAKIQAMREVPVEEAPAEAPIAETPVEAPIVEETPVEQVAEAPVEEPTAQVTEEVTAQVPEEPAPEETTNILAPEEAKTPEAKEPSIMTPEEISLQNGRTKIVIEKPYTVGGKEQQVFSVNGDRVVGFDNFAEKYPSAAEEVSKRNFAKEEAPKPEAKGEALPKFESSEEYRVTKQIDNWLAENTPDNANLLDGIGTNNGKIVWRLKDGRLVVVKSNLDAKKPTQWIEEVDSFEPYGTSKKSAYEMSSAKSALQIEKPAAPTAPSLPEATLSGDATSDISDKGIPEQRQKYNFKTSEEAQQAIDDEHDILGKKYTFEEVNNALLNLENKGKGLHWETPVSEQEIQKLNDLYKAIQAIDNADLSDWQKTVIKDSGLESKEAEGALESLYAYDVSSTFDLIRDWGIHTTYNLQKLYNHFAKPIDQQTNAHAEFRWGGTADNPILEGTSYDSDLRQIPWDKEALAKTEKMYNAIAKTQGREPISLSKITEPEMKSAKPTKKLTEGLKNSIGERGQIDERGWTDAPTQDAGISVLRQEIIEASQGKAIPENVVQVVLKEGERKSEGGSGEKVLGKQRGVYDDVAKRVSGIEKIARAWGKQVIWVKSKDPNISFNGAISTLIPEKIFLSIDSKNPHLMVLGHELLHTMKVDSPELYNELLGYLEGEIQNLDKYKTMYVGNLQEAGFNPSPPLEEIKEDLLADFAGDQFTNEDFWNDLSKSNPTLFEKVVTFAKGLVTQALNSLGISKNTYSEPYFKDINGSRKMLADVMSRYAKEKQGGKTIPTNPDIRFSAGGRENITWEDTQPTWSENMRRLVIDNRLDTKAVVDEIKKAVNVEEKNDPYMKAELAASKANEAYKNVREKEYIPALQEMVKENVSPQEMHDYLLNRHAKEANEYIAQIQMEAWEKQNPKTRSLEPPLQDKGSSIATKDAEEYLKNLAKDPKRKEIFERLAKPFDRIARESIESLVEADMLSRKEADRILTKYEHYAPLLRPEMEDDGSGFGTGKGHSVVGTSLKSRRGSTKEVGNILVNVMAQRESILHRIEKNTVAKAVLGLEKLAPKADFWYKAKPDIVKMVSTETGELVSVVSPDYMRKDNVIMALVKNKKGEIEQKGIEFALDNERAKKMVAGLKNLNKEDMNKVLDWSAKVTRFVASMNTQWNVLFGPVNFVRDFQFAMASISATELKGKQKEIANLVIPALSTVYKASRNMKEALASDDPVMKRYMEFRAHGAPTSYRDIYRTNKDKVRALNKEIALLEKGGGVEKAFLKAKDITLDWISDYNASLENATRFAVYQTARNSGLSADKSASLAKNVTVNFDRKGQLSQQAGALWAFFNASAQGLDALARTLNGPKGKKIIAGGVLLGAMQAMAMSAAGFDDEDEPPQFIRERSVIIPIGGTKFITVPMPLGFNFIPNIGRIFTEWAMSGGKNTSGRVLDLMGMFVESFNPMGASGMSLQTFMPTPLDPFVALAENKDWTGKPIYRENYSALNPTPGFTRTKDTASGFAKGLSWAMNKMSGGTENVPGFWSPTPDQIEYLMGQASGGVGRETIKAQQAIEATIKGDELPSYKIPLVGRFYGNTAGQAQTASKFYGNIKKLNMHEAEIKDKKKTGKERAEYLRDNPDARYWQLANKTEGIVRKLNSRKRELSDRGAGKDTLRNIDNLITNHMKRLNESVNRATK